MIISAQRVTLEFRFPREELLSDCDSISEVYLREFVDFWLFRGARKTLLIENLDFHQRKFTHKIYAVNRRGQYLNSYTVILFWLIIMRKIQ